MVTITQARYDGLADWYDAYNAPAAQANRQALLDALGPGDGLCLDLGCGTGQYLDAIRSADQLRAARGKSDDLVQADAAMLPFADGTFSTVAALWISTPRPTPRRKQ